MEREAFAVEIANLSYSYRSDWTTRRIEALKGISLSVKEGEVFGFLGHNGAGKTTTIKCLLGLIRPSEGEIRIFGKSHRDTKARECVGYLPEQPYFYDHLTVAELVTMYAALAGVPRKRRRAAVEEALDWVHIRAKAGARMRTLSKGLTQRVAMAQAIVAKPRLLVLDEPFSGLDPIGRKEFKDLLFDLKGKGTTIFISSHILGDIEFLCDRASIMAHGELKAVLALRDLSKLSTSSYELTLRTEGKDLSSFTSACESHVSQGELLRLVFPTREASEKALSQALEARVQVESYRVVGGTLEDLFVKLVQFEESRGG